MFIYPFSFVLRLIRFGYGYTLNTKKVHHSTVMYFSSFIRSISYDSHFPVKTYTELLFDCLLDVLDKIDII